jgi:hypothetical protein
MASTPPTKGKALTSAEYSIFTEPDSLQKVKLRANQSSRACDLIPAMRPFLMDEFYSVKLDKSLGTVKQLADHYDLSG